MAGFSGRNFGAGACFSRVLYFIFQILFDPAGGGIYTFFNIKISGVPGSPPHL